MANSLRRYETVWKAIVVSDKPVRVKVPPTFQKTFIKAVCKEKYMANALRKALGMPSYGILTIAREADIVTFQLEHNGDLL